MKRDYPLAILTVLARAELERDNATRAALDARRERDELTQERHESLSELARIRLAIKQARASISLGARTSFDSAFEAGMRGEK